MRAKIVDGLAIVAFGAFTMILIRLLADLFEALPCLAC